MKTREIHQAAKDRHDSNVYEVVKANVEPISIPEIVSKIGYSNINNQQVVYSLKRLMDKKLIFRFDREHRGLSKPYLYSAVDKKVIVRHEIDNHPLSACWPTKMMTPPGVISVRHYSFSESEAA